MEKRMKVRVVSVKPGAIKGQMIVTGEHEDGLLVFDLIGGLISVDEGDSLDVYVSDTMPGDLDDYDFCGRGYPVPTSGDKEILSVWGILFRFEPGIGLRQGVEYFLCMKK